MKLIKTLLAAIGLNGCSKEVPSSRQEPPAAETFTQLYVEALKAARPELNLSVKGDLELVAEKSDGSPFQMFLHNAFAAAKAPGADQNELIQRFVRSTLETLDYKEVAPQTNRIIPIIKDRAWLEEVKQSLLARGSEKTPEHIVEDFCGELVIVYAEDTDENIRYLTPDTLKETKLKPSQLRQLAAANLQRLLPPIEIHGSSTLYMVSAGGNFEASLLVLDDWWEKSSLKVFGELVVCVPSRDLLLVTGSEDKAGLNKMQQVAAQTIAEGGYTLTSGLFVRRDGRFRPFELKSAN